MKRTCVLWATDHLSLCLRFVAGDGEQRPFYAPGQYGLSYKGSVCHEHIQNVFALVPSHLCFSLWSLWKDTPKRTGKKIFWEPRAEHLYGWKSHFWQYVFPKHAILTAVLKYFILCFQRGREHTWVYWPLLQQRCWRVQGFGTVTETCVVLPHSQG